jgi:archaellum component FlaC
MGNNENKKVVVLPESETRILKEELEDFIVQANMLLNNQDFKKMEELIKKANEIVEKISSIEQKMDKFDEDIGNMVTALLGVINRLQESADVADSLKEQHKQLKTEIEKIIEDNLLTLKANLKQQIAPYAKKMIKEMKDDLNKELEEFKNEIERGIEKAKERFGFFEGSEILEVLKEIDLRRKRATAMFYTAIFIFIASAGVIGLTYFKVNKILKYTQYNAYTLQQITGK